MSLIDGEKSRVRLSQIPFLTFYAPIENHGPCDGGCNDPSSPFILGIKIGPKYVNLCPKLEGKLLEKLLTSYQARQFPKVGYAVKAGYTGQLFRVDPPPSGQDLIEAYLQRREELELRVASGL